MKKIISQTLRGCLVSALFLAVTVGSVTAVPKPKSPSQPKPQPQKVSYPVAPVFSAVDLKGKVVGSAQLAGKAYIVNFFASWCPPCRAEIPDMVILQNQYGRKGFTFIGVAVNETEPKIRDFIARNKISYPVVMADDQLVSAFNRYVEGGIHAIPTSFVVNSSGKMTQVITGARSKADFEAFIIDALKKQ
ncbi:MAG: TlpA family protein disulfide reductase [Chlorobium sp.]|nr:MAG: TlpA family protein disulfide reductase [Chlorobium sp.]